MGPLGEDHLLGEGGNKGLVLPRLGLAHKVHRAGGQSVEDPQVQGGHQKHRQGVAGQELLEEVNAAHAGHLHVAGDDVGLVLGDLDQGVLSVDRGGHHLDKGGGGQAVGDHGAGQHGVVHHHDPYLSGRYC